MLYMYIPVYVSTYICMEKEDLQVFMEITCFITMLISNLDKQKAR